MQRCEVRANAADQYAGIKRGWAIAPSVRPMQLHTFANFGLWLIVCLLALNDFESRLTGRLRYWQPSAIG
jgi:hypothetical protein